MDIKRILKTPEISLGEINSDDLIKKIKNGFKSFVIIFAITFVALILLAGFVVLYAINRTSPDMMTIAATGIAISASIACIGFLSGLITFGTYIIYFKLNLIENQVIISGCMAEMELVFRVFERLRGIMPNEVNSVLQQHDIVKDLEEHPAIRDRIAV